MTVGDSRSDDVTIFNGNATASYENSYNLSMNPVKNLRFITIERTVEGYMAVCEVKVYYFGTFAFPC